MIYVQTNLCVAAAWLLFRLLPSKNQSYRARKVLAQSLLIVSVMALPLISMLPDKSFPALASPVALFNAADVDGGGHSAFSPAGHVLHRAAAAGAAAPEKMRGTGSLWFLIFISGLLVMAGR